MVNRKSVSGFVTGIIGIILGVIISFLSFFVIQTFVMMIMGVIEAASESEELMSGFGTTLNLLTSINFIANVVAIIAVCFMLKKSRIGGIIMLIASLMYASVSIFLMAQSLQPQLILPMILMLSPAILMLVSAVLALNGKKTNSIPNVENK